MQRGTSRAAGANHEDVIAARLQAKGINVSRRTIAKHRQQLHVPIARQRREF